MINRDSSVEEIMEIPGVMTFFIENGISPFSCAGSFPGSLGKLLELKRVSPEKQEAFIKMLSELVQQKLNIETSVGSLPPLK
ncbi:Hypothetical protein DEACI_0772 [Acididesulfobacillus acetoxydans]|uniref:Uncharacterized protein n=1 Tax=Acididesulfobacillus acetoxydans TaxID=1561005 RepID=A0A8S0WEH3_9FIRM|nr:hypothetical protein [Acididesulfobacillus acetoxydans]CAA7600122.1 Hypothetical protein DEACI_0772 [Acididesulfobacillus acetoxydans]CEJ09500.1 Hypothetical protein DEACI_3984 [Acididesulfobacillus acetoxydans]